MVPPGHPGFFFEVYICRRGGVYPRPQMKKTLSGGGINLYPPLLCGGPPLRVLNPSKVEDPPTQPHLKGMTPTKPKLIIISGPTAVGKTDVALELAEPLGGEIISADAMQVYQTMDIGTAKPTPEQLARLPHHLIDVVAPDEPFSAAIFRAMADDVIQDLHEKGRPGLVVGGTGLYIKALIQGLFPAPEQDETIRNRLKDEAKTSGSDGLHARLQR